MAAGQVQARKLGPRAEKQKTGELAAPRQPIGHPLSLVGKRKRNLEISGQ